MGVMDKFLQYMKINDDDEYLDEDYLDDEEVVESENTETEVVTEE